MLDLLCIIYLNIFITDHYMLRIRKENLFIFQILVVLLFFYL